MNKEYLIRSADGQPSRIVAIPENETPDAQMAAGETSERYTRPGNDFMPPVEPVVITQALLLGQIDRERENEQMKVMTAGGAKKYVYNRKASEAIDSRGILATVLNALSLTDKQKRFPFAQAEAALTGEPLTTVLARFGTGLDVANTKVAAIEAKAQRAKRAVEAATTMAAKQAAAKVDWSK